MSEKKKIKKGLWKQLVVFIMLMVIGFFIGILSGEYIISTSSEESGGNVFLGIVLMFLFIFIAGLLHVAVHEAGHLVFGKMTGYSFSSYRIGSFMWIKQEGKIRFRILKVSGTDGQCLMIPPDMKDGKIPYVLYNLGGSIMNFIVSGIFLGLFFLVERSPLSAFFIIVAVFGVAMGLLNAIPMQLGGVSNDGHNAMSLGKNTEALRALWIQLKINEQVARGVRLKDMPDEWFEMPSEESMDNSIIASIAVFSCNRLMDSMEFEKADKQMEDLLEGENGVLGLYRSMMTVDRIYCELVAGNRREKLDEMMNKDVKKTMDSMKNNPSVLRTKYVYELLSEKNTSEAARIKDKFDKVAKRYPHPSEIDSERELMAYAEQVANKN